MERAITEPAASCIAPPPQGSKAAVWRLLERAPSTGSISGLPLTVAADAAAMCDGEAEDPPPFALCA